MRTWLWLIGAFVGGAIAGGLMWRWRQWRQPQSVKLDAKRQAEFLNEEQH